MDRAAAHSRDVVASDRDDVVLLRGVSWQDYERILVIRGDDPSPRLTYLEGALEIMSPSRTHESLKSVIGRLIEVYCEERGLDFSPYGSWTLKKKQSQRGAEPDECYVFGTDPDPSTPDLAIEVEWTSGRIDKLDVYRKLGVRELWYWREGKLQPYALRKDRYHPIRASRVIPGISLSELMRFAKLRPTSAAIRAYREAVRSK